MKRFFVSLQNELRSKARLRLAVWCILFVILLCVILNIQDNNRVIKEQFSEYSSRLLRLKNITGEKEWQERLQSVKQSYRDELKNFPLIKSKGLAKAGIENKLSKLLSTIGLEKSELHIDQFIELSDSPGIQQLTVRIAGALTPGHIIRLLYELESQEQNGQVARLTMLRGRNSRFELVYTFFFRSAEEAVSDD